MYDLAAAPRTTHTSVCTARTLKSIAYVYYVLEYNLHCLFIAHKIAILRIILRYNTQFGKHAVSLLYT